MKAITQALASTVLGLWLLSFSMHLHASSQYHLIDLGNLNDTGNGGVYDINNRGQVVGYNKQGVFLWDNTHGLQSLGIGGAAFDYSINNNGVISGSTKKYGSEVFIWDSVNDQQTLKDPDGQRYSSGWGINDHNQVVGHSTAPSPSSDRTATIWYKDGTSELLGTLEDGDESQAFDINNHGAVTGFSYTKGHTGQRAFYWEKGSTMKDIGHLGGSYTFGKSINDHGNITGVSFTSSGKRHAFLWQKEDNSMLDLGTLGSTSEGLDVNNHNQVVGFSLVAGDKHAFVWDEESQTMQDLNSLLSSDTDMLLEKAFSINDHGQIVGIASLNGDRHGFLLNPVSSVPEPSTLLLMFSGLALVGFMAYRRQKPFTA